MQQQTPQVTHRRAALTQELIEARIIIRIAELKVLAAKTALGCVRDNDK
jgi:hypothetical protein